MMILVLFGSDFCVNDQIDLCVSVVVNNVQPP